MARRYELTDKEWLIMELLLPNKPRGVPRVDDGCVLNGILRRFRPGAPWAEIPARYGHQQPATTSSFAGERPVDEAGCQRRFLQVSMASW
jgi:transposase